MTELRSLLQTALGDSYVVDRELNAGGMSRVFHALETALRREVVIKVLPPELASEVSQARFKQEIELAARLQHPNIIPILAAGAKDDLLFYVMPFVSGESLRHRLVREGRLPVEDAVRLLYEIADALAYAHAEGVIHRDIKPENILILGQHALLTDFGVARAVAEARSGSRLTATGTSVGTPGYMSPEQVAGEHHIDARSDIYSLAVVGYEMLAGAPPFVGPTAQAVLTARFTEIPTQLTTVRPEVPQAVSTSIARALEKDPAKRMNTAGALRDAMKVASPTQAHPVLTRRMLAIAATLILATAAGALFTLRSRQSVTLDHNLIAVAPFDVLDSRFSLWREGFVDILSRNLDGAGPLRTVSPTIVVHRWSGRADPASATQLGRNTGAGLVVIATLIAVGGDSVRVTASMTDVNEGRTVGDVDLRGESAHMDRVADSLTVALLRELGRTRPIGAVRFASLGSRSLPALRAFLRGEQFFRRTAWDSAIASYEHAVALDSGFALALSHMGRALTWQRVGATDSVALSFSLRAGAFNHGLTRRDSLLIAADSLTAVALGGFPEDTLWWDHARRAHLMLDEAARRYPEDPEVWYTLGEARVHLTLPGTSRPKQLEPFDRAIAIDSAFAPAYIHAVDLRIALGDYAKARQVLATYLGLKPTGPFGDGLRLAAKLLDPFATQSVDVQRILDTASAEQVAMSNIFIYWPDSAETAVRLRASLATGRHSTAETTPALRDPVPLQRALINALAFRGHMREAYRVARTGAVGNEGIAHLGFPMWAMLGAVPADEVSALFGKWLESSELAPVTLPWWSARADTSSIHRVIAIEGMELLGGGHGWRKTRARYWMDASYAYLALARRDTGEAVRRFAALPDSACIQCMIAPHKLLLASLYAAQRRDREAAALLEADYFWFMGAIEVPWRLERARVSERLGEREQATREYGFVADVWRNGDPELRPYVQEARAARLRIGLRPGQR